MSTRGQNQSMCQNNHDYKYEVIHTDTETNALNFLNSGDCLQSMKCATNTNGESNTEGKWYLRLVNA